jgi:flagellar hook assembly protein FlgD
MEINGLAPPTSRQGVNRFEELSSEDFMRIMFAELSRQDPLNPQDSKALLEQINSVRSIESSMRLMDRLGDLVGQNQFVAAGMLVGKEVLGLNEFFEQVQGRVKSAEVEGDRIVLTLDSGERVPFENVQSIME